MNGIPHMFIQHAYKVFHIRTEKLYVISIHVTYQSPLSYKLLQINLHYRPPHCYAELVWIAIAVMGKFASLQHVSDCLRHKYLESVMITYVALTYLCVIDFWYCFVFLQVSQIVNSNLNIAPTDADTSLQCGCVIGMILGVSNPVK